MLYIFNLKNAVQIAWGSSAPRRELDTRLQQLDTRGTFSGFIRKTAVAIGVTHTDLCATPRLADFQAELGHAGFGCVPVFEVDARARRDVCLLIEAVLSTIDPVAKA